MNEPRSFGPDKALIGLWSALCGLPAIIWLVVLLKLPTASNAGAFAFTLVVLLVPIIFASRFRATFGPTEFVYRRWGPTIRVPLSEIERLEVTNVTPLSRAPIGAFVVTKDGQRLPFWPKLFPREAVNRFFALGH
jgi:hypothetical protein